MRHSFEELVDDVRRHSFAGERRRYHRFRRSSHDDAAVADCVGSNLRCAHDWGWCEGIIDDPRAGRFYNPSDVVEQLEAICEEANLSKVRFSGMEPVMADDHLLRVLELLKPTTGLDVQIDTNGMLLSHDYLKQLLEKRDVSIRLSFKGYNQETFARLAGVEKGCFARQIGAFKACSAEGVPLQPVLVGIFGDDELETLRRRLAQIDSKLAERLELEGLNLCPANKAKLEEAGFDVSINKK